MTEEEKEKKRKRSEELAIEIREQETEYNELLDECRKLAELKAKQYDHELSKLASSTEKTYEQIINKLGRYLERHQLKKTPWKISAQLKRDLNGFIHRSTVYKWALSEWREPFKPNPKGKNQYTTSSKATGLNSRSDRSFTEETLTPQEQRYVKAVERELITDKRIEELVILWTGKDHAAQGEIVSRTPKGKHWSQILAEESKDHMQDLALQMTDSDLDARLEDLRIFENVRRVFSDIVYEVRTSRKKNESLGSV